GLVGGVFRFLTRRILIGASRHIEYDIRNDFFAHLEKLPPAYFQAHRTGDLMSRATNDLNAVRMMIGPSIMYSANTTLTFVAALTLMISIDARLTLYSLIPLPFVWLGVLLLLWLGSQEVIRGRITVGEFVAFNAYLTMLSWPMIAFGWVTNMLQRGMASWKRMVEVLDTEPSIADRGSPMADVSSDRQ